MRLGQREYDSRWVVGGGRGGPADTLPPISPVNGPTHAQSTQLHATLKLVHFLATFSEILKYDEPTHAKSSQRHKVRN